MAAAEAPDAYVHACPSTAVPVAKYETDCQDGKGLPYGSLG